MIKTLIIHLGDHKTGTTSIQKALASKSLECSTAQVIYPIHPNCFNHNLLARAIRREEMNIDLEERGKWLRSRLMNSDAEFGVISAEKFEFVPPNMLSNFLEKYLPELTSTLRLIAYIRPHADRLLSGFAERTKLGVRCVSPEQLHSQLLKKGLLKYAPRMQKWGSIFGKQLTFKPFDRSLLHEKDVVQDFFQFVLGGHSWQLHQPKRCNDSLCLEDLVLLREVHQTLRQNFGIKLKRHTLEVFGRSMALVLATHTIKGSTGTKLQLDRSLVEELIAAYRDDAIAVDQEFFQSSPMLTALENQRNKALEEKQSLNTTDFYSIDAIRQIHCWAEFIGRLMVSNQLQFIANSLGPVQSPEEI